MGAYYNYCWCLTVDFPRAVMITEHGVITSDNGTWQRTRYYPCWHLAADLSLSMLAPGSGPVSIHDGTWHVTL
jgi:hypothetical protein